MVEKKLSIALGVFLVIVLVASPMVLTTTVAAPIKISLLSFIPKGQTAFELEWKRLDYISKATDGRVIFEFKGAGDAVPIFNQVQAVQSGAADMAFAAAGFYRGLVPTAPFVALSQLTVPEEVKSGAYDFLVQTHAAKGLRWMWRSFGPVGQSFCFMTSKPVSRLEDLKGLRMSGGGIWEAVAPAVGMRTVALAQEDEYTAAQQKLIDAAATAPMTFVSMSYWEVAKYLIQPSFYTSTACVVMNLKKWESIPKDIQNIILKAALQDGAAQFLQEQTDTQEAAIKKLIEKGVKIAELTGPDRDKFLGNIYKAGYDMYIKATPVEGVRLYQLLQRSALPK
jgi:TRAP-type transport system periplasmic protein